MTRYLISFDDGAMTFPEEALPAVGQAAHAVVRAAQDAGVWIFGGGVESQRASIVATDPRSLRSRGCDNRRAHGSPLSARRGTSRGWLIRQVMTDLA